MKAADWYFDFVSPFAYLQLERLASSAPLQADVTFRPVVLAGILDHWAQKGPAEIPSKRRFTYRFVQWLSERDRVPLRFPPAHPFNPIRALRLAIAVGCRLESIQIIFRHIWRDGQSIADEASWRHLCAKVGVVDGESAVSAPAVKNELRKNGERAIGAKVFGVPTFVIDGEIFWGLDATQMVVDYLRDPGRFSTGALGSVADIPVGVQR